jgi:Protein of unknown function (DUF3435)
MRHDPRTGVFSSSYLNEKVRFDVQSAFLDRPSMDGLTKAFTHMSLTCDPRAPKHVPQEVMDALPPDPAIIELETARWELYEAIRIEYRFIKRARGTDIGNAYQKLAAKVASAKKKRYEDIKKQYRQDYHDRIHDEEMERHLQGIATDEYVEPVVQHQLPERTQVQEVMCDFSEDLTTEDIVRRRIRAIDRMVALCSRREAPQSRQRLPTFRQDPIKEESPEPELPDPELFPLVCAKTQCPICIGDERLTYSSRTFCYKRPSHMMDHVERAHLHKMPPGQQIRCHHPVCKSEGLDFNSVMQFKNHVAIVHKISLRP